MSAPHHRVLVVDDEANITELLSMALDFQGFQVRAAASGDEALALVEAERPDLIILDVMMPGLDGFAVAERLAERGAAIPIIFLTARDGMDDKLRGLNSGAEDYITKPFGLDELLARVRIILRRSGRQPGGSSVLRFEDLELDEDTREVSRAGRAIELTVTEYRLLRFMMLNPRRVLTRAQILDQVWEYDFGGDTRVLERYVSYLRKKLDAHGPPLIQTSRGVGYALRAPRRVAS
ncbi:MAG: response regulator transcription factor [Solirubrobacterales bacterium]|nr:response regulator transcription factor [Solirubrobacterales bacterium]